MAGEGFIETGVDKLVHLVETKKRVSTVEAAKTLGVSPAVIDEWADFLEEEGIISIDYKLATTYLLERKLSKKEVVKKAKEFHGSKDAFVRKIETMVQGIDRDTNGLDELKDEFKNLKKEIGDDLDHVKDELKELENFERLKKSIDKQMYEQQSEFRKKMEEMDKELFKERSRYKEVLDDISVERIKLQEERQELLGLEDESKQLLGKLEDFKKLISQIRDGIKQEEDKINVTEDHLGYLDGLSDKIKNRIESHSKDIDPLIKESKINEEKINKMQEDVLKKVVEGKKKISDDVREGKAAAEKFKNFFSKKGEIEAMLSKVDREKVDLKEELNDLIKKAHAFDLANKSSNVKKYMVELNKKYKEIDTKKNTFKKEIDKLVNLIKKSF